MKTSPLDELKHPIKTKYGCFYNYSDKSNKDFIIASLSEKIRDVPVLIPEAITIWKAVRMTRARNMDKVVIESDLQLRINPIKCLIKVPNQIINHVLDIVIWLRILLIFSPIIVIGLRIPSLIGLQEKIIILVKLLYQFILMNYSFHKEKVKLTRVITNISIS